MNNWLADKRRDLDRRRERLALEWASLKLARWEKRLAAALKGEWHEEDHPRADDGRFGDKPGEHSGEGGEQGQSAESGSARNRPAKPKSLRAAGRYRNAARRRRVIQAVRVEGQLSEAIGGYNLPDSEPADVIYAEDANGKPLTERQQVKDFLARREVAVRTLNSANASQEAKEAAERVLELPCHFVEVKTLLVSAKGAVHMSKAARRRKERWQNKYGASFSVVAVDRRRGRKHSGHEVHLAVGELAGTFNLHQMDKMDSLANVLSALCPECGQGRGTKWATLWRM